jgi:hypothetical protein
VFVTTSKFTEPAKRRGEDLDIDLFDRSDVVQFIQELPDHAAGHILSKGLDFEDENNETSDRDTSAYKYSAEISENSDINWGDLSPSEADAGNKNKSASDVLDCLSNPKFDPSERPSYRREDRERRKRRFPNPQKRGAYERFEEDRFLEDLDPVDYLRENQTEAQNLEDTLLTIEEFVAGQDSRFFDIRDGE